MESELSVAVYTTTWNPACCVYGGTGSQWFARNRTVESELSVAGYTTTWNPACCVYGVTGSR